MNKLTHQDCDLLNEAMEVWEADPANRRLRDALIMSVMARTKDEAEAARKELGCSATQNQDRDRIRKERATLLKAKLLGLRDTAAADVAIPEAVDAAP